MISNIVFLIFRKDLQDNILNSIVELLAEQENSKSNIITMALEHIHANEVNIRIKI